MTKKFQKKSKKLKTEIFQKKWQKNFKKNRKNYFLEITLQIVKKWIFGQKSTKNEKKKDCLRKSWNSIFDFSGIEHQKIIFFYVFGQNFQNNWIFLKITRKTWFFKNSIFPRYFQKNLKKSFFFIFFYKQKMSK